MSTFWEKLKHVFGVMPPKPPTARSTPLSSSAIFVPCPRCRKAYGFEPVVAQSEYPIACTSRLCRRCSGFLAKMVTVRAKRQRTWKGYTNISVRVLHNSGREELIEFKLLAAATWNFEAATPLSLLSAAIVCEPF
jgi:hypothetical protein